MMIISFCNEKGGTGKTSTTALVAWELAKRGKKILAVDCDPQGNLTNLMVKTANQQGSLVTIDPSLFSLLINREELQKGIINVATNLDLIPCGADMNMFSRWLDKQSNLNEEQKVSYLKERLKTVDAHYDFIFLDVSPTMSLTNDNVFVACEWLVIMLQTQQRALLGAHSFLNYLQSNLIDEFGTNVDVLGILPVLTKARSNVDMEVLQTATSEFGPENMFDSKVTAMERVKRYDLTGITDQRSSVWDKTTHEAYDKVATEFLKRLEVKMNG